MFLFFTPILASREVWSVHRNLFSVFGVLNRNRSHGFFGMQLEPKTEIFSFRFLKTEPKLYRKAKSTTQLQNDPWEWHKTQTLCVFLNSAPNFAFVSGISRTCNWFRKHSAKMIYRSRIFKIHHSDQAFCFYYFWSRLFILAICGFILFSSWIRIRISENARTFWLVSYSELFGESINSLVIRTIIYKGLLESIKLRFFEALNKILQDVNMLNISWRTWLGFREPANRLHFFRFNYQIIFIKQT